MSYSTRLVENQQNKTIRLAESNTIEVKGYYVPYVSRCQSLTAGPEQLRIHSNTGDDAR